MPKSSLTCQITKWSGGAETTNDDIVAVEEPLQVVVDGRPLAVLMRTPGDDEVLVMGFLLTEGIIESAAQVRRIDLEARDNHAMVFLIDEHECDWERLTRHLFSASSCGLCGKATVDAILQSHPPIEHKPDFDPAVIQAAPDIMRAAQANFDSTGGIHASGIFSQEGELLVLREDIGRHNALDKVIGEGLIKEIDFSHCFLLVSGRISFELMQKAVAARLPLVAGISAPSSLAVSFAKTSNQSLIGFLRPPTMNIYH
ncbi:formate dehydrogenase accessory sulfurtransferase FdhD [Akkermansiaceae bacterium]|nr:formate dehydrogenase accessory sulfurtransferase FdhD [bacterium]MDA7891136.1 formate dehydrogenase accessory sulfurtransferase FdhD [Akkermansiaceae bacterium]MDA7930145.1 formate dehydrogenase accessory sulfurtransferase FdhD [Akkermansiaceae bacterium]MDA7933601.1 formate dehydrogenase accessory sulfurtransferase FdhD [Akkermansiaceae bacterium]MDF1714357.1 formate dehydrogenase accessory sulfurtransferase FdhD [Akkermansiaceae bacterium]